MLPDFDGKSSVSVNWNNMPRIPLALLALVAIVSGVAILWYAATRSVPLTGKPEVGYLARDTRPASPELDLAQEDADQALAWLKESHGVENPSLPEVLLAAGGLAVSAEQYEKAVRYFAQVATDVPRLGMTARLEQGVALIKLNYATQAEQQLRSFLDAARESEFLDPAQVLDGFKWLTYLLSVQVRQEDRKKVLEEQHAIGLADPLDSKQLFFPNLLILNSPAGRTRLAKLLEKEPTNVVLQVAAARYQTFAGEFDDAILSLKKYYGTGNEDLWLASALAEAFVESDRMQEASDLVDKLPSFESSEPWLLTRMRGEVSLFREQWDDALRYFKSVLEVDPANAPAQMGVAMAYEKLRDSVNHKEALRRSGVLAKIRVNLGSVQTDAEAACLDLAKQCQSVEMKDAARVFEFHADRIRSQPVIKPSIER
ncbi:hypothetical protein SH449x_004376 [Pirellulaceae bacterium SH449]